MNNLIYAYKKKNNSKIVYVGQTSNLEQRHKQHIQYEAYNKNRKEYNYPLSRGIRKYGSDMYELIILEDNLLTEELNDREKYWIAYYNTYWNGYNQTIGGSFPVQPKYDDNVIKYVIEMLKDEDFSYQDIIDKTGLSLTHIHNINTGKRRQQKDEQYPIRPNTVVGTKGIIFSQEQILEIHNLLKNTKISINKIAKQYNCNPSTISYINKGKRQVYKLADWNYPIRDNSNMKRSMQK